MRKIGDISTYKHSYEKFLFLYDQSIKDFIKVNNESFYNEYVYKRKCIYCIYDTDQQTGRILPNCYEDVSTRTKFFKHLEELETNLNKYLICFENELNELKYYDFILKNTIKDNNLNNSKNEIIKNEILTDQLEDNQIFDDDLPSNIILNKSNNLNKNWLNNSNNNINKIIKINLLNKTTKKRSFDEIDKHNYKLTTNDKQLKEKLDSQSSSSSTISLSLDKPLDILLDEQKEIKTNLINDNSINSLEHSTNSLEYSINSSEYSINQSIILNKSIEQSTEFRDNHQSILNEPMEESNDESIDVSNDDESSDYPNSQSPINYLLPSSINEQRVKSIKEYELEFELTG